MKIFVGYDHRGVKMAYKLIEKLINDGHEVNEPFDANTENDDYPEIAKVVCEKVLKTKGSIGLLICGTGIGMAIAANRFEGIRAVLSQSEADAYFARRHEDANVLVFAAGYSDGLKEVTSCNRKATRMVDTFINTKFEAGRHIKRVALLDNIAKD